MLTDIFAYRYEKRPIWTSFSPVEQRMLVQCFAVTKDALPYRAADGKILEAGKLKWQALHDQLARELGLKELSQRYYSYAAKNPFGGGTYQASGYFDWDVVVEAFVTAPFMTGADPDVFIKERLSFVELALRLRGTELAAANAALPKEIESARRSAANATLRGIRISGDPAAGVTAHNDALNTAFSRQVEELNERFRRAGTPLTYHNGFIQLTKDEVIEGRVAEPFWKLVSDPLWANVDEDMKEALDRRDSDAKDPHLYAAKALESVIKIVSQAKGWTRGTESGVAQFIDNLVSKANGGFLEVWEGDMLKEYFKKVRNPAGHGPGPQPMPTFTNQQVDWAIESAMSWARSIIRRM